MRKTLLILLTISSIAVYAWPPPSRKSIPVIVGAGSISTALDEFGASFTPDGKTCFFSVRSPSTISNNVMVICESHFQNGRWGKPVLASYSGRYKDFNPSVSADGNKIFFVSNRPVAGDKVTGLDLWFVERKGNQWSEPKNVGAPVNGMGYELACHFSRDNTLYYSTTGTDGNLDIYSSKWVNDHFESPVRLDSAVNSPANETDPFVAPDGSYLLFTSTGRPDAMSDAGASVSYPRSDLYISYYTDGKWTRAENLGPVVNTIAGESNPWISADGKTLYFSSERNFVRIPMKEKLKYKTLDDNLNSLTNGLGNIYQVPVSSFLNK